MRTGRSISPPCCFGYGFTKTWSNELGGAIPQVFGEFMAQHSDFALPGKNIMEHGSKTFLLCTFIRNGFACGNIQRELVIAANKCAYDFATFKCTADIHSGVQWNRFRRLGRYAVYE